MNIKKKILSFGLAAGMITSMISATGSVTASAAKLQNTSQAKSSISLIKTEKIKNGSQIGIKVRVNNYNTLKQYEYTSFKGSKFNGTVTYKFRLFDNNGTPITTWNIKTLKQEHSLATTKINLIQGKTCRLRLYAYIGCKQVTSTGTSSYAVVNVPISDPGGLDSGATTNIKIGFDSNKTNNSASLSSGIYDSVTLYYDAGARGKELRAKKDSTDIKLFDISESEYYSSCTIDSTEYNMMKNAAGCGNWTLYVAGSNEVTLTVKSDSTDSPGESSGEISPSNTNFEDAVDDFFNKYKGRGVDYPGAGDYNQCVSLTAQYIKEVIGQTLSQPGMPGGYAFPDTYSNSWGNADNVNIIKNNFTIITGNAITNVKKGDIIVTLYQNSDSGHVMIAAENKVINYYNCGGTFHIYDQNGTGNNDVTTYREFWPGDQYFAAVLRPNVNL